MKKIILLSILSMFFLTGCQVVNNITTVEFDISDVSTAVTELVKEVDDGVVGVLAQDETSGSTGSGFIMRKEGNTYTVVTNNHVVESPSTLVYGSLTVLTSDGVEHKADFEERDIYDDMAMVTFTSSNDYTVLEIAPDDVILTRGEFVVAIGSPLGFNHFNTVTLGVVSQTYVDMSDANMASPMVQHDAAINQGNSGGPLFNLKGQIVGMNTLKYEQTPSGSTVIGMYFSVTNYTLNGFV